MPQDDRNQKAERAVLLDRFVYEQRPDLARQILEQTQRRIDALRDGPVEAPRASVPSPRR